jgi:exodeoxyribonuclease V alpha subunit
VIRAREQAGATDWPLSLDQQARDPLEARFARHASGLLRQFNLAGVLSASDVHVARALGSLTGDDDETVMLATALAVRAPRLGHVLVDLDRIRETAAVDTDEPVNLGTLDWPEPTGWVQRVSASPLVGPDAATADQPSAPLRLLGSWLYLDRYWAEELQVARALLTMDAVPAGELDPGVLSDGLKRLFGPTGDERQRLAADCAVRQRFAVVAGGPGTGKTTTVARIVALLYEQACASGRRPPLVALAAPTGKAAARLQEAVHAEAVGLAVDDQVRAQLLTLRATTLHRLLGWRPGSNSRFAHSREQRLAHDAVIVDETSMVSLSLMARLIEALRTTSRLVLVGDPGQLASIEAGAVLGDIVGPAADLSEIADVPAAARPAGGRRADRLGDVPAAARPAGGRRADRLGDVPAAAPKAGGQQAERARFSRGIVVLERVHRFGGGIAELATAIRRGDAERVLALLTDPPDGVTWIDTDLLDDAPLAPVRTAALDAAREVVHAAAAGDASHALAALGAFRILCAHRRGPYGVAGWTIRLERWLADAIDSLNADERWYVGRPLLVTENDYELGLNNGDTGVVVRSGDRAVAAFERAGGVVEHSPSRLGAIETVYAMTIHKSQGSQFDAAAVLLPEPGSRILTRELLYTAATRARRQLTVVGTHEAVRAAVERPVARASGLRWRLWETA